jgi:hypothetical protein
VTELVQHLSNGHHGILMVVTNLAVD